MKIEAKNDDQSWVGVSHDQSAPVQVAYPVTTTKAKLSRKVCPSRDFLGGFVPRTQQVNRLLIVRRSKSAHAGTVSGTDWVSKRGDRGVLRAGSWWQALQST